MIISEVPTVCGVCDAKTRIILPLERIGVLPERFPVMRTAIVSGRRGFFNASFLATL